MLLIQNALKKQEVCF